MQYLKADTNTEVLIGPAVAVGDGFTPVTTLSLSTADEAEIIKYGGATALTVTSISANAMTAITGADGYYTLDLSTSNTDTEGFLTVLINDDSLILPLRVDFMVVNANVYDSLFAAATTDYLQVDTIQVGGATEDIATETKQDVIDANVDAILVDTGTTIPNTLGTPAGASISADIATVDANVDAVLDDTGTNGVLLAATATSAQLVEDVWDEATAGHVTAGSTGVALTDILADTNELQTDDYPTTLATLATAAELAKVPKSDGTTSWNATALAAINAECDTALTDYDAATGAEVAALNDISVADILTTQMTESYSADGAAPTLAQSLCLIQQMLGDFAISGTTLTVKKVDGTTTAATFTLDDGSNPTSITRAT